jgi:hypothetical protein
VTHQDIDVKRLLEAFGRAQLEIHQLRDMDAANVLRIRELEHRIGCVLADNALLTAAIQKEVATVRMAGDEVPAEELIPGSEPEQAEQPPTLKIIRSRTPKGNNPALYL